ncbi:MAG: DUF4838 domain-containing protein, partial [Victivallales bacterium]|nr:DUF4838 domain-containing protein [Victivallales bacterium]
SFCLCENCRRLYKDHQNISNLKFHCMGEIARRVAAVDPQAGVSTLAYIRCLDYPEMVELPPNLSIQLCLTNYCWWHPVAYKLQHGIYKEWVRREAKRRVLTLWTYLFGPGWDAMHFGNYKFFPGVYPHATGRMFREFLADGIRGWFTEVQMQFNGLEAYVACRLCYDSSADPETIIAEYFRDSFGEAGPAVQAFYQELEDAYWNPDNCPKEWLKDENVFVGPAGKKHPYWGTGLHSPELNWSLGTDERMARLGELFEQARRLVRTPQEKTRLQRLEEFIWNPTLDGKKEQRVLAALPKVISDVTLPKLPELGGELTAVPWEKAHQTADFTDALGRPTQKKCRMWFARDNHWLYLRLVENAPQRKGAILWRNNLEVFFARAKSYPLLQVAVSPEGENAQFRYTLMNDVPRNKSTETGMRFCTDQKEDSWELRLAIPLEALPFGDDGAVTVNFFRTWGAHGDFASWTPSLQSHYIAGLNKFGVLRK